MWTVDAKGGLVNLDNAVWVGITNPHREEHTSEPPFAVEEALLTAHMLDGSAITLEAGTEEAVRARLQTLEHVMDRTPKFYAAGVREVGSAMRHED